MTRQGERGWALISVLGALVLLSVIAVTLISLSVTSLRIGRTQRVELESEALARAAISRAVLGIIDPRPDKRWRVDGVAQEFVFDGIAISVRAQDELGKIDLNAADGDLIARLLTAAGKLDADAARRLADKIMDWREADDLRHLHGATRSDYAAAGHRYRPRNGPFQSVDELRLVLDMTPELFARIAPAITVFSHRPTFDPQVAPREALLALPGMDENGADARLRDRETLTAASNAGTPLVRPGVIDPSIAIGGRCFAITVTFTLEARRYTRSSVVMITGDPKRPFLTLATDDS